MWPQGRIHAIFFLDYNIKMPYKKRYNNKRRFRKRQVAMSNVARFVRKGAKTALYAYSAYKLAHRLADKINPEYKEFRVQQNPTPDYNGAVSLINNMPQGTAQAQRVGDSVKMQTLTLRGIVSAGATLAETVRVIVFLDKENLITTGAQMLDNAGGGYAVISSKQEDNKYQTRILFDRVFHVSPGYRPKQSFTAVIPINIHTHFTAGTTTIKDGALRILSIGQLAAPTATVLWQSYLSYTDD